MRPSLANSIRARGLYRLHHEAGYKSAAETFMPASTDHLLNGRRPYKTNKNDVADAEAICEAVGRANMRFVPIKSIEQQAILSVHRVRQGFVKARTAQANQIRGLLGEFGLVIPQGIINVAKRVPDILEDASNELPVPFRQLIDRLTQHLKELDRQVKEFEREIIAWHRSSELSCK